METLDNIMWTVVSILSVINARYAYLNYKFTKNNQRGK